MPLARLAVLAVTCALAAFAIAFLVGRAGRPESAQAGAEPTLAPLPTPAAVVALPKPMAVVALPAMRVRHARKPKTKTTGTTTAPTTTSTATPQTGGTATGDTGGGTGSTPSPKADPTPKAKTKTQPADDSSDTGFSVGG